MKKYLTVFALGWQDQFTYRINFILWRFRNVLRFLMTFFLWKGIFSTSASVYGYSQNQMLTYVFIVLFVQTLVISAPSADNIGGEIGSGDLSNYLVKPIGYLRYWFTQDLASKLLNLFFAVFELSFLYLAFRPQLQLPALSAVLPFLLACSVSVVIYFFLASASRFIAFWTPENTWGLAWFLIVLIEMLAGGIFPLDILPPAAGVALQFTPFPYLVYFPIAIYVGKITGFETLRILFQASLWAGVLFLFSRFLWRRGLKIYSSYGH